ncbi:hypothetical protein [Falsibacillus albus]|uniref:hypothetical protein n=1 Tax=Falsibacillus albus TaxID=2478915 RepID=UPI0018F3A0BE|nr:hypothetical protein [Falsibacillus albus]
MEKLLFIGVFFLMPLYAAMIWSYFYPEDSILVGKRWMYEEEPEVSKTAIRYTKFSSITLMIGLPIVVISFLFKIYILRLSVVILPLVLIMGALKIYSDGLER